MTHPKLLGELVGWLSEAVSGELELRRGFTETGVKVLPLLTGGAVLGTITYGSDLDFVILLYDLNAESIPKSSHALLKRTLTAIDRELRMTTWGRDLGLRLCKFALRHAGYRASYVVRKVARGSFFYLCYHLIALRVPVRLRDPGPPLAGDRDLFEFKIRILEEARKRGLRPRLPKGLLSTYSPKGLLRVWSYCIPVGHLLGILEPNRLLEPLSMVEALIELLSVKEEDARRAVKALVRLKGMCRRYQIRCRLAGLLRAGLIGLGELRAIARVHEAVMRFLDSWRASAPAR